MSWYPFRHGDSPEPNAMQAKETEDELAVRAQLSNPDDADYALITDFLAGELSPEDRARVEERLQTDARFRALAEPLIMIWNVPGPLDREEDLADRVEAERSWQMLKKRIDLEQVANYSPVLQEKRATRRRGLRVLFAAILTALGVGLYESFRPGWLPVPVPAVYEHTDAPAYEELSTRLPDETKVTLLAGTHLSYSRMFSSSYERTLNLDGEGTFVVPPGPGALVVHGRGVEVIAPHGRFTVQAYDAVPIAYVTVHEGMAEVKTLTTVGDGQSLTLHAGQSARVGPGQRIERVDAPLGPRTMKTERAVQQDAFVYGPLELAPRGLALVEAIGRDFGERPHDLSFIGKDTIDVTFWNPAFWRTDMQSKEFPPASLPLVRKAAEHIGAFVWTNYGRDSGINVIRITFVRMRRVSTALVTRDVPAQQVTGELTRKQLETGPPQLVSLTMSQR